MSIALKKEQHAEARVTWQVALKQNIHRRLPTINQQGQPTSTKFALNVTCATDNLKKCLQLRDPAQCNHPVNGATRLSQWCKKLSKTDQHQNIQNEPGAKGLALEQRRPQVATHASKATETAYAHVAVEHKRPLKSSAMFFFLLLQPPDRPEIIKPDCLASWRWRSTTPFMHISCGALE